MLGEAAAIAGHTVRHAELLRSRYVWCSYGRRRSQCRYTDGSEHSASRRLSSARGGPNCGATVAAVAEILSAVIEHGSSRDPAIGVRAIAAHCRFECGAGWVVGASGAVNMRRSCPGSVALFAPNGGHPGALPSGVSYCVLPTPGLSTGLARGDDVAAHDRLTFEGLRG